MKLWWWRRTDQVAVWLVAASLCVLAGHAPVRKSGAADREALAALSNPLPTASSPSSSKNSGTGADLFVPVILTASGAGSSYYTSELTLTNRGSQTATLRYTYRAAAGGGGGAASETLAPGRQKIVPNAIDYLRSLGIPIPASGNRIGTLRVGVSGSSEVSVTVRTTTRVADGRAGLAYPGVAVADGFEEAVYLSGLRQNLQDRSNVAFQNMGTSGNITLRTTVFSGAPEAPGSHVMADVTLAPGGFRQLNGLLATAGYTQGYVKVERVSGTAPFYAYGVINDQANSDGSFVFPVTASSLAGVRGLTLPVVIEHPNFTTELILTNFSDEAKVFDIHFVADAIGTPDKTATVIGDLIPPGGQAIIPDAVQMLRESGAEGIGPRGRTIAGAAFFTAPVGDLSGVVIGARTGTPGGGGQYSVFYNAVPYGAAFEGTAWIDALQQNEENRSNLALVNTGEVDGSPSVFQLDLYDGETGLLANTVTGLRVAARGWRQINGILDKYAPGTTQGYVRIQKISGNNPFLAYGVINDGGAPGQRSGDGAYLPASVARGKIDDPGGEPPGTSPATDREALEALYEATGGPNWVNKENWLTDAPLGEWFGVDTDGSGRVTRLAVPGNELSGSIPPVLGQLAYLKRLNLGSRWDESSQGSLDNQLGGAIPPELGRLTNLEVLDLGDNLLTGPIPTELGNLVNLEQLNLHANQLSGRIPRELGNLTELRRLNLSVNEEIEGEIPPELGNLAKLEELELWRNKLRGRIPPELGQLTGMTFLWLEANNLHGEVPIELGNLTQLWALGLSSNALTGLLPESLLGLEQLVELAFSDNDGLCAPGTAPFALWLDTMEVKDRHGPFCNQYDIDALESLYMSAGGVGWKNSAGWLSGPALDRWHGVVADSVGRVVELNLSRNRLAGRISVGLADLERMTSLRVGGNALVGPLPLGLAGLPLRELHYADTQLCAPDDADFRAWLNAIPSHQGTDAECEPSSGHDVLAALYEATDGPNWQRNDNWLTDAPLSSWHGVSVRAGSVVAIDLSYNNLTGPIPPEVGNLAELQSLDLSANYLRGEIPRQLGNLTNLLELQLAWSDLEGEIPPELGDLTNLQRLILWRNSLSGPIPPELGKLARLLELDLDWNDLEGRIPPELGDLTNLRRLFLRGNSLSGPIPPELGSLASLGGLWLAENRLEGSLPGTFFSLASLSHLDLSGNMLSGTLPGGLDRLQRLETLRLANNDFSGGVPPELGNLPQLSWLYLNGNPKLSGPLAANLTSSGFLVFLAHGTGLCAPDSPVFREWLASIPSYRIRLCNWEETPIYLTQAAQSREYPVPLVAGEDALLRVFVTAGTKTTETLPPVRATFFLDGSQVHLVEIPAGTSEIPTEVREGEFGLSANVEIPGSVIQPGLAMVVEIDPSRTLDPSLGVSRRIPAEGRTAVNVRAVPALSLTLVPFVWTGDNDRRTADLVADLHPAHELFWETNNLLPVGAFEIAKHEPVLTDSNSGFDLLGEVDRIRTVEGGTGHWAGLMYTDAPPGGIAQTPGKVSFSKPHPSTIAHELGHNFGLDHAPCGYNIGGVDPDFPQPDGRIGVWGYDPRDGGAPVPPSSSDLMGYCANNWISDYHFSNALRFRIQDEGTASVTRAAVQSLLVSGRVGADGTLDLDPAFVVDAPATVPDAPGPYELTGRRADGGELFSITFDVPELADGDGRSSFVFALPVQAGWDDALASITLSGPGGTATLDKNTDRPMAILLDPQSGQVRGFLRDPTPPAQAGRDGARVSSLQGLEVIRSRGLPDAAAWQR